MGGARCWSDALAGVAPDPVVVMTSLVYGAVVREWEKPREFVRCVGFLGMLGLLGEILEGGQALYTLGLLSVEADTMAGHVRRTYVQSPSYGLVDMSSTTLIIMSHTV